MVYMKKGDVWKYGETTQGEKRYSDNSYENTNFNMKPIFYGTKTEILIQEKDSHSALDIISIKIN